FSGIYERSTRPVCAYELIAALPVERCSRWCAAGLPQRQWICAAWKAPGVFAAREQWLLVSLRIAPLRVGCGERCVKEARSTRAGLLHPAEKLPAELVHETVVEFLAIWCRPTHKLVVADQLHRLLGG